MINDVIVSNAKKYLGKPYVWGGDCEAEGGYDCSGLVYNALKDSGIKCTRDTAQGYYNKFQFNKGKASEAGCLLFFGKTKKNITHVAISLGGGMMIESIGNKSNNKNNKGRGVTISKLNRRLDFLEALYPYEIKSVPVLASAKKNLKIGCTGIEVNYLQQDLNYVMNSKLSVDGVFGMKTRKALIEFQKRFKLVPDGIYGSHSYTIMKELLL